LFNKATCFDLLGHHQADTRNARQGLRYLSLRHDLVDFIPSHLNQFYIDQNQFP